MPRHALLSPSAASRWMKCPASPVMSQDMPYQTSFAAVKGTIIHMMAETLLKDRLEDSTLKDHFLGETKIQDNFHILIDEQMVECAEIYVDYIFEREGQLKAKKLIEEQVTLEEINTNLWGTLDCALITKDVIEIIDLKSGSWPVEANNTQLRIYALGILERYPYVDAKVILTIVQPYSSDKKGPVKSFETTPESLVDWAFQDLKPAADACLESEPKFVFGDHCRFCLYKQDCQTYNLNSMEAP
ncbi:MAG: hypothetical protein CMQ88_00375 [Gammaproteobacteria bacterium]|jgi:hypothetical protein|nr:hypothetical protein [Gammaproteobacteria bacterium]